MIFYKNLLTFKKETSIKKYNNSIATFNEGPLVEAWWQLQRFVAFFGNFKKIYFF